MAPPSAERLADVIVVGAGAAGFMAAAEAARRGRRTLLLEKQQRPGLKILISGGGRCNLTTTRSGADLEAQFGSRRGRFLRHALRSFPPTALRELFEGLGVPLQEEDLEKLFPVSQRARDVLDALLRHSADCGVELHLGTPLRGLERCGDQYRLATDTGTFGSASVVLATGGRSYPKTGATGDGYGFCRQLGHTVTATVPALAPLVVEEPWLRELQGIVLGDAEIAVLDGRGRPVNARRRPILFTHHGLSGPAPMDLAGDIEERGGATVRLDLAPDCTAEQLQEQWLAAARSQGRRRVESQLPANLPERLRRALCVLGGAAGCSLAELPRDARRRLLALVKDLRLPVAKSRGFHHAEVTRGGIALDEVEPRTMESRLAPGLYLCGELLDIDGPIGGFNFQAAFATGRLAGLSA
ncbi:MAG: NAD(P)/FAD-dependent oxidoreductase [Planctomycetota bacterium]|nr:NAD(P)/FAD-dependent oxidoreductase [Planctomycetota bacterium]